MPKPLLQRPGSLGQKVKENTRSSFDELQLQRHSTGQKQSTGLLTEADVRQRLRQKRSEAYVALLGKLDAGQQQISQTYVEEVVAAIQHEFPELTLDVFPIGLVAKCYLGEPYEVHTLDLQSGGIIHHYKRGEPMPGVLERARGLAMRSEYEFIEVYNETLRPVRSDGTVTVINIKE
ncbi:hypothetical protein [uncultured Veillonella sp.]|uniref:hypothetical protein n=1 Tax=uncultured Veillonella sp. TaxID=159268 RepID=UPI0025F0239E|nr:hypothetical protein [uncultured Veillonella sp.]